MGPLALQRGVFMDIGGYDEGYSEIGVPGSVAADCELQARLWLSGLKTVAAMPPNPMTSGYKNGNAPVLWSTPQGDHMEGVKTHTAWKHPKMAETHAQRMKRYHDTYEAAVRAGTPLPQRSQ